MESTGPVSLPILYHHFSIPHNLALICYCSDRFARLIGRKEPVAALCTMIVLSYTKLLQTVLLIGTPSFDSLEYPDGTVAKPWLPDAKIKYFSGKHIVLLIIGLLLVIVGTIFTIILIFGSVW